MSAIDRDFMTKAIEADQAPVDYRQTDVFVNNGIKDARFSDKRINDNSIFGWLNRINTNQIIYLNGFL